MLILEIKKVQSEVIDVHIVSASNSFIVIIMLGNCKYLIFGCTSVLPIILKSHKLILPLNLFTKTICIGVETFKISVFQIGNIGSVNMGNSTVYAMSWS